MRFIANRARLGASLGLASALLAQAAWAEQEVNVYGVANFGGAGECDNFSTHSRHTASAANFRAPFDDLIATGDWDEANTLNNLDAHGRHFTDPAEGSTADHSCCQSYQPSDCSCAGNDGMSGAGVDQGDVMFIHTHGGSTHVGEPGNSAGVAFVGLQMGNEDYDCRPRSHEDWEFGNGPNGDLEIAVVKACQSMDLEVWQGRGHWEFSRQDSVFTMFNAFHGNTNCSDSRTADIGDYADASVYDGAGDNWMDTMHSTASANDDCPVSVVFGHEKADRDHLYAFGGWLDREDTGAKDHSTIYYLGGCSPGGGSVLPNN